jgi:hypothetical protein
MDLRTVPTGNPVNPASPSAERDKRIEATARRDNGSAVSPHNLGLVREFRQGYGDSLSFFVGQLQAVDFPITQNLLVNTPESERDIPVTDNAQENTRKEIHPFVDGWNGLAGIAWWWGRLRPLFQP